MSKVFVHLCDDKIWCKYKAIFDNSFFFSRIIFKKIKPIGCAGCHQDYYVRPIPIMTLDLDYLDLDWTGLDLGLGKWTFNPTWNFSLWYIWTPGQKTVRDIVRNRSE